MKVRISAKTRQYRELAWKNLPLISYHDHEYTLDASAYWMWEIVVSECYIAKPKSNPFPKFTWFDRLRLWLGL